MSLIDVQRAVVSICFRAEPSEALFEQLGERSTWLLYRQMVRERLLSELRFALPRSCALVGDAAFERAFVQHLDREPPRTRFFREVVLGFVKSAVRIWELDLNVSSVCADMARYEAALWEVADLAADSGAGEFAFDRVPVVSSALRLLTVAHAVHLPAAPDGQYAAGEYRLCVHRAHDAERPRTWLLTRTTHDLLTRWQRGERSVTETVQQMAAERGVTVDAKFVDGLCGTLAQFLELGIVLGSR